MKKIGLVVKSDAKAKRKADELEKWLRSKKIEVIRKKITAPEQKSADNNLPGAPSDLFCIFVIDNKINNADSIFDYSLCLLSKYNLWHVR